MSTTPDPFAGTATPPAETATPDIPVVNAEGEEVKATNAETPIEAPADADAPLDPSPLDADAPEEESDAAREQREKVERAQAIMEREQEEAAAAQAAQEPQEDAQEAASAPEAATDAPEAPTEPQTATDGGDEPPSDEPPAPPATGEPEAAVEETPAPAETADGSSEEAPAAGTNGGGPGPRGGKGEMRQYKLLYMTGERAWTEFDLKESHENVKVIDGEKWMMARNNEHAKRIGFYILGAPKDGVTIFPVPKGAWKISRVKPAPPQPERERLVIE